MVALAGLPQPVIPAALVSPAESVRVRAAGQMT